MRKSTPVVLPFLSLLIVLSLTDIAAGEPQSAENAVALPAITIEVSADAGAEGLSPAYAGGQTATGVRIGVLGTLDYMDVPFGFNAYTEELIRDQQAASVGEVLLNDPAVRVARGFGNFQQLYKIRGLPIFSDDMSYNGLYGLLPRQYLAAELIERVEVLRGANAFLNGAAPGGSGLGGAVNIVPKRAPSEPLTRLRAGAETGVQGKFAVDVARRLDDDRFGLRLNLARRQGDTAVDGASSELSLALLGADYNGEGLRFSADLGYQDYQLDATQPSVTIGAGLDIPDAPRADRSVAQPWTFSNERDLFASVRAEYDFTDTVTGWAALGTRQGDESGSFANPTVIDTAGNTTATHFANNREDSILTGELGLRAAFATGALLHRVSLSAIGFNSEEKNAFGFSSFGGVVSNLYDPVDVPEPAPDFFLGGELDSPRLIAEIDTSSLAIADEVSILQDRLRLTLGGRYQQIEQESFDFNTGESLSHYDESEFTPVAGLVLQVTPKMSLYANYIEGLSRGEIAPSQVNGQPVANAGESLQPFVTEQVEAGLKYDFGNFGGFLGVYQSKKPLAGIDGDRFRIVSEQRSRGLELSLFGEPIAGLTVLGGVSLLDSDVDGAEAIGAPDLQANLTVGWDVPQMPGLALEGRSIYTSSQFADNDNTQKVPSWNRFDLGVKYSLPLGRDRFLDVSARVENVADRDYWASSGGFPGQGYLTVGEPRKFLLAAALDF